MITCTYALEFTVYMRAVTASRRREGRKFQIEFKENIELGSTLLLFLFVKIGECKINLKCFMSVPST